MLHCLSTSNFRLPISNNTTPKKQRFRNRGLFHFTAMEKSYQEKKPRLLCLHGFRTSGEILKKQVSKWPDSVLGKLDLVFLDGPFPAQGKSDVEGFFPPPYYEWFQFISVISHLYSFAFVFFPSFFLLFGLKGCLRSGLNEVPSKCNPALVCVVSLHGFVLYERIQSSNGPI